MYFEQGNVRVRFTFLGGHSGSWQKESVGVGARMEWGGRMEQGDPLGDC